MSTAGSCPVWWSISTLRRWWRTVNRDFWSCSTSSPETGSKLRYCLCHWLVLFQVTCYNGADVQSAFFYQVKGHDRTITERRNKRAKAATVLCCGRYVCLKYVPTWPIASTTKMWAVTDWCVDWWNRLSLVTMSTTEVEEPEDLRDGESIAVTETTEVLKDSSKAGQKWTRTVLRRSEHCAAIMVEFQLGCCTKVWCNTYGVADEAGGLSF